MNKNSINDFVIKTINSTKIIDIHTHLFPASFGKLALWGVDELITYHYLIAEAARVTHINYSDFWAMNKKEQADYIFKALFIDNTPVSEACRGVLTSLNELGIDLSTMDIDKFRKYYENLSIDQYIDKVFELSNIDKVIMTNDPFDKSEIPFWTKPVEDKRFLASLRLDTLLNDYHAARYELIDMGYNVGRSLNGIAKEEIRRFLREHISKINAVYMSLSLPPDFRMPQNTTRNILLEECVIPVSRERNIPLALMIGVKRLVNPDLYLAGDSIGKSNIETIEYLCGKFNKNKFMITMLSRENQHELCVVARKFNNLFLFGCWWFLNNPMLIKEMTKMRFELLGMSFHPQHSDARILDQLVYKWKHNKKIIAEVLTEKYEDLFDTGWPLEERQIERDIENLFGGNFKEFIRYKL